VIFGYWSCRTPASPSTKTANSSEHEASKDEMGTTAIARPPRGKRTAPLSGDDVGAKEGESWMRLSVPWGGGSGALGRDDPGEGSPSAPMSFYVDHEGHMYVLDQVNGRIVRFGADGKVDANMQIDRLTAQDMAPTNDGGVAVLDRFGGHDVGLYDANGNLTGSLPLVGEGIDDEGDVTGVFVDGDDVYAEVEHATLVKVGDTSGNVAASRDELPGRPSRDGESFLKAGIIDPDAGRVYVVSNVRPSGEMRFTRELRFGAPTYQLLLLDTDLSGTIYLAAEVQEEGGEGSIVSLQCLDKNNGEPIGSAVLPANVSPEETVRDLAVLDEGGVVYAQRTADGITYEKYNCE
jgi:hypothetical protein